MTQVPKIIQLHNFWNTGLVEPLSTISFYKQMMPDYEIMYFTDVDPDFLDKYDGIFENPEIDDRYKADVLRYWYLYKYGGFYVDMDTRPLQRFDNLLTVTRPSVAAMQANDMIIPYFCFVVTPPEINVWIDCLKHCYKRIQHGQKDIFNLPSMFPVINGEVNFMLDAVCDTGEMFLSHYIIHFRQSQGIIPEQEVNVDHTITRGGQMVFPHKGKAPRVPAGYEATSDPYVFLPILLPCTSRKISVKDTKCCGAKTIMDCAKYHKQVTRKDCKICQDAGENTQ